MKVLFVYRSKKLRQFSIERCFQIILDQFSADVEIEELYLPEERADPVSLLRNIRYLKKYLAENKFDIVQITGDAHYVAAGTKGVPTVLTVHDLRGMLNYQGPKRKLYEYLWVSMPCKKSDAIVSISKATEMEILKTEGEKHRGKMSIIPDPIDGRFVRSPKAFNRECPRILMIGTNYNKNVDRVIEALKGIPCTFDLVGPLSEERERRMKEYQIQYIASSKISDEEIYRKYCECDIVMFPSTYEGFGMIIIEGQSVGRPVITSKIEPMLSVSGNATCLVDPESVESIRRGLLKVIGEDAYRESLVKAGYENAAGYQAKKIAAAYEALYRRLLSGGRK